MFFVMQAAELANATDPNDPLCNDHFCVPGLTLDWYTTWKGLYSSVLVWLGVLAFGGVIDTFTRIKKVGSQNKLGLQALIDMSTSSRLAFLLDISRFSESSVRSILNIATCVFFCIRTYKRGQPDWMTIPENIVLGVCAFRYCVYFFFLCSSRVEYAASLENSCDLLSIASGFLAVWSGSWLPLTFLRGVCLYESIKDMLDVFNINKIHAALANAAALFVMLIFVFACLIYMVESLGEVPWFDYYYNSRATYDTLPMTLSEAAYFTMISISTVGYGDYSPSTVIGRVLTMFFILGGIMFFTTVTHDSVEMVRYLRSGYGRYKRLSGVPHTVIVGDMSADTLGHLFQEFFTESRRN
jgi:hypothetical protein